MSLLLADVAADYCRYAADATMMFFVLRYIASDDDLRRVTCFFSPLSRFAAFSSSLPPRAMLRF